MAQLDHGYSHLFRLALGFIIALLVATMVGSPAEAKGAKKDKLLCQGYSSCAKKGYSNFGYEKGRKGEIWGGMDSSPNCARYVAWRLTKDGKPRPEETGRARDWGYNVVKHNSGVIKTKKPKKGDIAWWSGRAGSPIYSHVAYVDYVYKNGDVRVSNDNWNKTFAVVKFHKGHKRYPSAFLRFPKNDGTPAGRARTVTEDGDRITASSYQWEADSKPGAYGMVSWGGPKEAAGVTLQKTSVPLNGGWYASKTFSSKTRPSVAYVYALNSHGTKGSDRLLGVLQIPKA